MDSEEDVRSNNMGIFKALGTYCQETFSGLPTWLVFVPAKSILGEEQVCFYPLAADPLIFPRYSAHPVSGSINLRAAYASSRA